ncbi:double-strand break repair protein AddB [Marivivens aquimaris]|uniref:double-strand break repair protein AddB n=1 Tax=Marivivens aquimaris TaxID=2774876 RepID=UPI002AD58854|nr:double-strand break repair protein AddB [Marivivens aquimaris]
MMFQPTDRPRIYGLPTGVDFASELAKGITDRLGGMAPHEIARTEVYLNTRRMQRRLREVFDQGPARLLPRVRLVTDLARDPASSTLPQPISPLRRRLELSRFVSALLESEPDLAPRSALYDLSDSLAALMDEMHGEGVPPEAILDLDVADSSGHWERALKFIRIVTQFYDHVETPPDTEARQRMVIEQLIERWEAQPPDHPIIVAGSTGSRGATAMFMDAVSRLPQGAIILPGVDFDMPASVWDGMTDKTTSEDHPQYRFRHFLDRMEVNIRDLARWTDTVPFAPARNKVVSLSLRPAPVTDQWLVDGPALGDLDHAMDGVTLVEAPTPRAEAETIALRLRAAMDEGLKAALITPDRMLTRQVAAALDRWNIKPDDSAGHPLHLSAPGRMLRQVAALLSEKITGEMLLSLLKHPLVATGVANERGDHIRLTNKLEMHIRRYGPAYPDSASMNEWAKVEADQPWAHWVGKLLDDAIAWQNSAHERPLVDHIAKHIALTEAFAAGPNGSDSGELWKESAGRTALNVMSEFGKQADAAGDINARDYLTMMSSILQANEVRNPDLVHSNVLFWGALEARVQSADLVILGGMNDGVWPETPSPDPWLNREMRQKAGLLLPERRIGLSAHDYQQAVAAKTVWITRSIRSDEAETVPSRWVNRLTNLLDGLPDQGGRKALAAMRERGAKWIAEAHVLSQPAVRTENAHRPSPQPPVDARPKQLSVTEIQRLIRDPYSIYAKRVLGLKKLDPLVPTADAPLRGDIIHKVLEDFIREGHDPALPASRDRLMEITRSRLAEMCPWPTARRLWYAKMERVVDKFLRGEIRRQASGTPEWFEEWGELDIPDLDMKLVGKADRIDLTENGEVILYDYKTGSISTVDQQKAFDKQLLIEAAMAARGAFKNVGKRTAAAAEFVAVGSGKDTPAPFEDAPPEEEWARFLDLIRAWRNVEKGYTARMAAEKLAFGSDYDHLSRYGEWDMSHAPKKERLK